MTYPHGGTPIHLKWKFDSHMHMLKISSILAASLSPQ